MKLTQEEKRIKIAEARGWEKVYKGPEPDNRYILQGRYVTVKDIPDHFTDANALRDAWESLTYDQKTIFAGHLRKYHKGMDVRIFRSFFDYGAEALGLTLGLWEEGQ